MAAEKVTLKDRKRTSTDLKSWLDDVAKYDREFKKWETRSEKIIKRYRDDFRNSGQGYAMAKFNILWSNVQTLTAATFAKMPKPDVSRRHHDNDAVGRVASLILERALDYEIQHYTDYRSNLKNGVQDRFLGGRATSWIRYEPHFKAAQVGVPTDGLQITEDVDEADEELDYECSAVDYVHPQDFGHSVARTWEEVNRVWRKVYMTKDAGIERFGKDIWAMVPMDAKIPGDLDRYADMAGMDALERGCVYEGWDKAKKKAVWFTKGVKDFLDERDDPLGLEEFFPCPRPLWATLTNETLVPIPDFTLYQDQANELDILADRKDGLIKALQVKGVYDASETALGRLFTEGENNTLVPVKNWQAFSEKNGLKGAIDIVDIIPIAQALEHCYKAERSTKEDIYEITGISDIIRGQTQASETATAQQIKGQYASLRLKQYQEEVSIYATQILQIKAQIICKKYDPKTILTISAADQLSDMDKRAIPQAMALLVGEQKWQAAQSGMPVPEDIQETNPLRSFRIEIAADTLVYMDEQAEKESRMEFLTANGAFMEKALQALQMAGPYAPALTPLIMEMWKFGVTGFKIGKTIEGAFDEATQKIAQIAAQPPAPPPPDPKLEAAKIAAQAQAQQSQADVQVSQTQAAVDMQRAQTDKELEPIRAQAEGMKAQAAMAGAHASMVVAAEKVREAKVQAAMPPRQHGDGRAH